MKIYEYVFQYNYNLYVRLYDTETKTTSIIEYPNFKYVPELYIKSNVETEYKDFYFKDYLKKIEFKNTYELFKFLKNRPINLKIYGNVNRPHKYIRENYNENINYMHVFRTLFLDIETRAVKGFATPSSPTEEISLIQTYDNYINTFVIFGTKPLSIELKSDLGKVVYKQCNNEVEMLKKFVKFINFTNPSIITGFNSNFFDIPYIVNRMSYIGLDFGELSPINAVTTGIYQKSNDGIEYTGVKLEGILQLDLRDLYIKYTTKAPSRYSLNEISKLELNESKIPYNGTIEDLYKDYEKFIQYGLKDVELLIKLESKLRLIKVCQSISYICGVNADEVSGTLVQWSALMFNRAYKQNIILPLEQYNIIKENPPYPGGWVRVITGLHKNVCSYDFTSLYPNIIREFNIGLDNFIPRYNIPKNIILQLEKNRSNFMNENFNENVSNNLPTEIEDLLNKYFYLYSETYDKSDNDSKEEFLYFKNIIDNKNQIQYVCKKYGINITPNGCMYFTNGKSLFAEIIGEFFEQRLEFKKLMKEAETQQIKDYYDLEQYKNKILMNAAYGTTALAINPFSFGKKMSESITTSGRFLNMWVSYKVNLFCKEKYGLDIISEDRPLSVQCDTDSNYFEFSFIETSDILSENKKQLKDYCNKIITPVIENAIQEAITSVCNKERSLYIGMEQESILDKLLSCARKRYVGRYYDEYSNKEKYKITGLPMIDKVTPPWTKMHLYKCLNLMLDKDLKELRTYIDKIKNEFKLETITNICANTTVNCLNYVLQNNKLVHKISGAPCPIQSRGSINYNKFSETHDLKKITEGEKVYIIYLKYPNNIINDNICCSIDASIEQHIKDIIDYDTLFEKCFIQKLEIMSKYIGFEYKNELKDSLNEWF